MNWKAKSDSEFHLPQSWQLIEHGENYCTALCQYFSSWFAKVLGYQFLHIGGLSAELACHLPLRHQSILMPELDKNMTALQFELLKSGSDFSVIQANPLELPFIERSIDACLLANTLNFTQDPHQLLREVDRVLTDNGYLFLSLFNPFNPLSLKQHINMKNHTGLSFRQFTIWRVIDWLELLNFDILEQQYLGATQNSHFFSPLIVLVAQKRTYSGLLKTKKLTFETQDILHPLNAFRTDDAL